MHDHAGIVRKVARSFARDNDIAELQQEIQIAIWQALPSFRGESKASTFVYRVAHNYALTWTRKRVTERRTLEEFRRQPRLPAHQSDPAGGELLDRLYVSIRRLPEIERSIVLLSLDELSYREMADVLGISETNVGVRLNRARKRLAELMEEDEHELRGV